MGRTWALDDQSSVIALFEGLGALQEGHFQYTSGKHGSVYVAKDMVIPNGHRLATLARMVGLEFAGKGIDVVFSIAPIGSVIGSHVANVIGDYDNNANIVSVFAEKKPVVYPDGRPALDAQGMLQWKLVVRSGLASFIKPDSRILLVEDILNTGGSAEKLLNLALEMGAKDIYGLAALWNRGGVTAESIGVENLFALCDKQYSAYVPEACPQCAGGVPLNRNFGHAK